MRKVMKTAFGILILIVGISIFLYPNYREWTMKREIKTITEEAQNTKPPDSRQKPDIENTDFKRPDETEKLEVAELSGLQEFYQALMDYNACLITEGQDISETWNFRQLPVDVASLNNGSSAVGYIEIPDISLTLPLYIGATETNMSNGAVVLSGTSMPIGGIGSNCVIAAHRGWGGSPYFRDIDQLKVGSEVIINNLWEKLSYQVTSTRIIHETEDDILQIQPDKDIVTLFSCYPYMSIGTNYRLVIVCERTITHEENEIMDEGMSVSELIDMELEEKGIIIEETFTEDLAQKEDLIRVILPTACIMFTIIIILFRLRPR